MTLLAHWSGHSRCQFGKRVATATLPIQLARVKAVLRKVRRWKTQAAGAKAELGSQRVHHVVLGGDWRDAGGYKLSKGQSTPLPLRSGRGNPCHCDRSCCRMHDNPRQIPAAARQILLLVEVLSAAATITGFTSSVFGTMLRRSSFKIANSGTWVFTSAISLSPVFFC